MSEQGEGEKPPGSLPVASHIHIHSRFHINHDPSTPRKPSSPASEEALDLDYAGSSEEIDPVHRHDRRQDEDKILSGAKDTTVRQEKERSSTPKVRLWTLQGWERWHPTRMRCCGPYLSSHGFQLVLNMTSRACMVAHLFGPGFSTVVAFKTGLGRR
jgi:hypothetical protein